MSIEQTVEKILSLLDQISVEEKNRKSPIPLCEVIDEMEEKPRGCISCISKLPRGKLTICGCGFIEKEKINTYDP